MATRRLTRAGRWLATLLNVRSGEHQVVALLLVHSLFVGFARVFSVTASEPLFLVEWGADKLPYLYIGSALATAAAGAAYTRVAARLSFVMVLVVNLSMLLTVTGAFRLLLTAGGRAPSCWPSRSGHLCWAFSLIWSSGASPGI